MTSNEKILDNYQTHLKILSADNAIVYEELIEVCKKKLHSFDEDNIFTAFLLCYEANKDTYRKSGEPNYLHSVRVAILVMRMLLVDETSVISALLHDIYETSDIYNEEFIEQKFGPQVAMIVDNVNKIQRIQTRKINLAEQLENYRTILVSLFTDVRILLVKLADRLHDMQTIEFLKPESQQQLAYETLYVYCPFINRIGLYEIRWQLEDLSFKILDPPKYHEIEEKLAISKDDREKYIAVIIQPLKEKLESDLLLKQLGIKFSISGRSKHIFSIHNKILNRKLSFEELYDIFALRIIAETDNPNICHYIYGVIASVYPPAAMTFKDYIWAPKKNGYQSIHAGVITADNKVIEVQIRTDRMHLDSEKGVAAHFRYKSNNVDQTSIMEDKKVDNWLSELRELFEQSESSSIEEMLSKVNRNFFLDDVHVLTPKNDHVALPHESIPIDYAFKIHTRIGHHYIGAKVNSTVVPIDYKLKNGDLVEIITSETGEPQAEWLNYVVTPRAVSYIRRYVKENEKKLIEKGKSILLKACSSEGIELKEKKIEGLIFSYEIKSVNQFYIDLANGTFDVSYAISYLKYSNTENFVAKKAKKTVKAPIKKTATEIYVYIVSTGKINWDLFAEVVLEVDNINIVGASIKKNESDSSIQIIFDDTPIESVRNFANRIKIINGIQSVEIL
ncbi:MAG: HD domain-containing protein [bacterium]